MGQKVSPNGLRLGITRDWNARWMSSSKKEFATSIGEDIRIRAIFAPLQKKFLIDKIVIDRTDKEINIKVITARPGAVTGENGETVKKLEAQIKKAIGKTTRAIHLHVENCARPDWSAAIMAAEIAKGLESRQNFRIIQKQIIGRIMRSGAKGVKTLVSGRLNGVDMARSEGYSEGIVPLHTLRSDIDYAHVGAHTTYGRLGVKVWICRGEVLNGQNTNQGNPVRPDYGNKRPYDPNRPRPPYDPNRPKPPYDPNRPKPPYDPNRPKPAFDPNRPRPPYDPNRPRPAYDPNRPKPPYQGNGQGGARPPYTGPRNNATATAASTAKPAAKAASVKPAVKPKTEK